MKTLVTGARGQVGIDLVESLLTAGDEVIATDLQPRPPSAKELSPDLTWQQVDVTDPQQIRAAISAFQPDRVFHLAAILSARGETDPAMTYRVNQGGLYETLEACRLAGTKQLIFASTIAVYGSDLPSTVSDDVELLPSTMYGVTKAAGEMLGNYYSTRFGLDFRGLRFPGLISASLPGGGTSDYAIYIYLDGVRKRRYEAFCRADTRIPLMYMPDAIRALSELSAAPKNMLTRSTYNIAAFSPTAHEIAASVAAAIGPADFSFRSDPARQAILDSWPQILDDSKARTDWNWKPAYDLESMTEALIPEIQLLLSRAPDPIDRN